MFGCERANAVSQDEALSCGAAMLSLLHLTAAQDCFASDLGTIRNKAANATCIQA
jgi:hypothetical protein